MHLLGKIFSTLQMFSVLTPIVQMFLNFYISSTIFPSLLYSLPASYGNYCASRSGPSPETKHRVAKVLSEVSLTQLEVKRRTLLVPC